MLRNLCNRAGIALLLGVLSWTALAASATWEDELRKGKALEQQGRVNEAVLAYAQAERLSSRPETLRQLAFTLHRLNRYALCQQVAARWVSAYPEDIDALDGLGVCALKADNPRIAIDAFRRAIARQDSPKRQLWLAHAAYDLGEYETARTAARKGMEEASRREEMAYVLGASELALGNVAEAKRHLGDKPLLGLTYVPAEGGWRVIRVMRNGPADRAGLRVNDIVTHFNGQQLGTQTDSLASRVADQPVGAEVTLTFQRDGQTLTGSTLLSLDSPVQATAPRPKDVAGDDAWSENPLRLHGVRVEPIRVVAGDPFRIHIELAANASSSAESMPVTLTLYLTREGRMLTQVEWVAQVPTHQRATVIKEVPRAAGEPGHYDIEVLVRGAGGLAASLAQFEIVAVQGGEP